MKNQIKYGAILGYINMFANLLITLLYIPFMLKMMGQSEYGLYSLVASIIGYFSILDMGFGNAMIRFTSKSQAKNDGKEAKINGMFLILYTIIGILSIIIGIFFYLNIQNIFASSLTSLELSKAKTLFIILLINVSISFPLSVFDSYIASNEKYIFMKSMNILKTLLKPAIMLPLLIWGYKSISMATTVAIINIFFHIISMIYCYKKLFIKIDLEIKKTDFSLLRNIVIYSFFIFLNIIVDSVFTNTDQIILGIVSGTVAVSVYSIANQISIINTQFSTIISSLFLPKVSKLLEQKDGEKKVSELFIRVSRIQIYIMLLILTGFIIFGKKFITMWAGDEYYDAYYIVLLLITPAIIPLTQNIGISIIQAKNIHQFRSIMFIVIAIINIGISIPLSIKYGGIGAAIGTLIANLLGQIITMNIFYYKKAKINIPLYWKFFIKIIIQVTILLLLFITFRQIIYTNLISYCLSIIIYTIFYLALIYLNMNLYEKEFVIKMFRRIIRK